jgi:3-oxoacyl-[acyl-carrier protein] reductase
MDLKNARVLVTGGGSGIGLATARALVERGASVVISGRNREKLKAAATAVGASAVPADVSNEADVAKLIPAVVAQLGGFNALINNAGIGTFGPLVDLKADDFRRVWATNVLGAMLVARESARHFVAQNVGNIVNVASTAGARGFSGGTSYVASKFALTGMTECWRAELRKSNVRVMQINPSEVITDFYETNGLGSQPSEPTKIQAEDIARVIVGMLELHDRAFVTDATVWATNPAS